MNQRPSDARDAAAAFRAEQHLGSSPIADLVTVLEDCPGVHVAILPSRTADHHGMRATDPARGVTVLAAATTPRPVRLRSTLAHELGHHLFNDPTPTNWSERTPEEKRADEFARHLLIPIEGLRDVLGPPNRGDVTEAVVAKLVERFAVSPQMVAIQLGEAGYLRRTAVSAYMQLTTPALAIRYGWSALYQQWSVDSQIARPPRRIITAAINAYIAGDATLETLANLQDATSDTVQAQLADANIVAASFGPDASTADDIADNFDWTTLHRDGPTE